MGSGSKRSRQADDSDSVSEEESEVESEMELEENEVQQDEVQKDAELEDLEKEYSNLRHQEQDLLKSLKRHKEDDLLKGQAVKNQKVLWDKTLELRFLLQKAFSNSNKLPQKPLRSSFCNLDKAVSEAYSDLINSSQQTINCLLELQEAMLEKNPSITQVRNGANEQSHNGEDTSNNLDGESDEEWLQIKRMHYRIAPFRNSSIDKWQRKTQVTTGVAAFKGKLHAFNQNISEQVTQYMRDPSRMVKRMQLRRPTIGVLGEGPAVVGSIKEEDVNVDGDPELLDDSEFYQQLLKEFFDSCDPNSSVPRKLQRKIYIINRNDPYVGLVIPNTFEMNPLLQSPSYIPNATMPYLDFSDTAFYALKKLQTKKRKIVDRRASKGRKIRYNQEHEKLKNFMAPEPMNLPAMAPKLFESLFGQQNRKSAFVPG